MALVPATAAGTNNGEADAETPQATVAISHVNHYYGEGDARKQALYDINLTLRAGEVIIMTGPSGCGKTTLLTLIGALRSVQEGSIRVLGHELHGLQKSQLMDIRRNIGFIFQAHNLFESLTACQNVYMALELNRLSTADKSKRAADLLTQLGLGERLSYKPHALSGGQKQRVAIARALANTPRLILADEPTAALDKQWSTVVVQLLKQLASKSGTTVLLVTHDSRILEIADRIVTMSDGYIESDVQVDESVRICRFLTRSTLFAALTPSTLTDVAEKMTLETFPVGASIIRQGEIGDKFYLIRKGSVEVHTRENEETRVLATLKEGELFGEVGPLTGEPRNATVIAKEPVEVFSMDRPGFEAVLNARESFKEELVKVFAQRYHR